MSAPFRIENRPVLRGDTDEAFRQYLQRLLKMIPGEVVGLYLVGNGFIPDSRPIYSALWAVFCLLMVFVVRIYGTRDPERKKPSQPIPVGIAAIAFVIWVYSLGGPFAKYNIYSSALGSLLVLVWSFLIPILYKGEEVDEIGSPGPAANA
jgi:hypothetical protein